MPVMTRQWRLLTRLSDGRFHSGQHLGAELECSRAVIWKAIAAMQQQYGVAVQAVPGRGYRIPGGVDLLQIEAIQQYAMAHDAVCDSVAIPIETLPIVDSTNTYALAQARSGAPSGAFYFAEMQTAGRGRRGRHWASPFAKNIYLSLLWRFEQGAAALNGISLVIGLAVVRALTACGVPNLGLKWPNDVLWHDRKMAGILVDIVGDGAGAVDVVIGIGANVLQQECLLGVEQPWVDAETASGKKINRNQVAGALVRELLQTVPAFESQGFAHFHADWQHYDALIQRRVAVTSAQSRHEGVAYGIDIGGAFMLKKESDVRRFTSGEVSVCLQ